MKITNSLFPLSGGLESIGVAVIHILINGFVFFSIGLILPIIGLILAKTREKRLSRLNLFAVIFNVLIFVSFLIYK